MAAVVQVKCVLNLIQVFGLMSEANDDWFCIRHYKFDLNYQVLTQCCKPQKYGVFNSCYEYH